MGLREQAARWAGAAARNALRTLARRDASSFPGKLALRIDPDLIRHATASLTRGSVVIVGTNGKTTTTNLIADALENAGVTVCCNRSGANMNTGIASVLLERGRAQQGVIECDELWLPHVLPQLQPNYLVLLNLFRDQLDRSGEIDVVQQCIRRALEESPHTTLLFNADDPLCTAIAQTIPNRCLAFGIAQSLGLAQNTVADAQICQSCSRPLEYAYHQYGQLGDYHCPSCGFSRPDLDFSAQQVHLGPAGVSFSLLGPQPASTPRSADPSQPEEAPTPRYHADLPGSYMTYNLTAAAAAATLLDCPQKAIQQAMSNFAPQNGRLERLTVGTHSALVNLAKNPTGMNQNLRIALSEPRPFVLGVFINDHDADGHDVSWLWDVDFEELATRADVRVFAGGIRKHDLQVRLKYAGVPADLVESPRELVAAAQSMSPGCPVFAIANYTALPAVKTGMEQLAQPGAKLPPPQPTAAELTASLEPTPIPPHGGTCAHAADAAPLTTPGTDADMPPVVIGHFFPQLLNLYGDGGNVTVLRQRLAWRGIPVQVRPISDHANFQLDDVDLVFLGGAPDREQEIASAALTQHAQELQAFLDAGGPCLAICGGYQMMGRSWILNGQSVPGLGIGAFETRRAGTSRDRLVGNMSLRVPGIAHPVTGYENHAGRTYLDHPEQAFGQVVSREGHGNNDHDRADGYAQGSLVATYLHGPVLAKNPELADLLLSRALERWSQRHGLPEPALTPLDDSAELQANAFMADR